MSAKNAKRKRKADSTQSAGRDDAVTQPSASDDRVGFGQPSPGAPHPDSGSAAVTESPALAADPGEAADATAIEPSAKTVADPESEGTMARAGSGSHDDGSALDVSAVSQGHNGPEAEVGESDRAEARPWHRFAFGGPRTGAGTLVAAVLALGVGFAVMTQVRQNEKSGLDNLSQSDLVALLANVNDQSARLQSELDDLRTSKAKLQQGGDAAAVADAQKRLDEMQILNGTVGVNGPGITISIAHAHEGVTSANVLDAVQELRDAGAESIEIAGHRVVAASWFADIGGHAGFEGEALPDAFTITAIGDPHTMGTAMAIPGGVTDTLTQAGAQVKVAEGKSIKITSTVPAK